MSRRHLKGHWNRVHAGQTVKVSPLPPRPPGLSDEITIGQERYRIHNHGGLEEEPTPPVFSENIEGVRERVALAIGAVVASKNVAAPHAAFSQQLDEDARRKLERSSWNPPIALYVHHDDAEREYAYDRKSPVGRLDKGLDEAAKNGWQIISMKRDWKVIFPFEK